LFLAACKQLKNIFLPVVVEKIFYYPSNVLYLLIVSFFIFGQKNIKKQQ